MHLKIITHENVIFDEDVNEIYTKGLATSSSGLGEGALYKSSAFITTILSFFV